MAYIQWHRIHISIPKERRGHLRKYLTKPTERQTQDPAAPCQMSGPSVPVAQMALPLQLCASNIHINSLGWFYSLHVALLDRHPIALASPTFGVSTANILGFMQYSCMASCPQGWHSYRDSPATCCLNSQLSETTEEEFLVPQSLRISCLQSPRHVDNTAKFSCQLGTALLAFTHIGMLKLSRGEATQASSKCGSSAGWGLIFWASYSSKVEQVDSPLTMLISLNNKSLS